MKCNKTVNVSSLYFTEVTAEPTVESIEEQTTTESTAKTNEIVIGNSQIQIQKGNLIKAIPKLGPHFEISFDLKINSWGINSTELESVLRFTSNDGDCCQLRSCCGNPAVFINPLIGPYHSHIMVMTKTRQHDTPHPSIHPYVSVPGLGKWFSVSIIQVILLCKKIREAINFSSLELFSFQYKY